MLRILGHNPKNLFWKLGLKRSLSFQSKESKELRPAVINSLLKRAIEKRYLEVGLYFGETFEKVSALSSVGVDPCPRFRVGNLPSKYIVHRAFSDDFFSELPSSEIFDVVFVDGLHEAHQCLRDVLNSIDHLSNDGAVVIDDVWPRDIYSANPNQKAAHRERLRQTGEKHRDWQGDVYRTLMWLADNLPNAEITIVGNSGGALAVIEGRDGEGLRSPLSPELVVEQQFPWEYADFLEWISGPDSPNTMSLEEFLFSVS